MKIRTGFVANSSSSSFIVCVPKSFIYEKCPTCGRGNEEWEMLKREINENGYYSDRQSLRKISKEDTINELKDWEENLVNSNYNEKFLELDKISEDDYEFFNITLSNHNDKLRTMIRENPSFNLICEEPY